MQSFLYTFLKEKKETRHPALVSLSLFTNKAMPSVYMYIYGHQVRCTAALTIAELSVVPNTAARAVIAASGKRPRTVRVLLMTGHFRIGQAKVATPREPANSIIQCNFVVTRAFETISRCFLSNVSYSYKITRIDIYRHTSATSSRLPSRSLYRSASRRAFLVRSRFFSFLRCTRRQGAAASAHRRSLCARVIIMYMQRPSESTRVRGSYALE